MLENTGNVENVLMNTSVSWFDLELRVSGQHGATAGGDVATQHFQSPQFDLKLRCGFWHVHAFSEWVSSGFTSFLQPPKE